MCCLHPPFHLGGGRGELGGCRLQVSRLPPSCTHHHPTTLPTCLLPSASPVCDCCLLSASYCQVIFHIIHMPASSCTLPATVRPPPPPGRRPHCYFPNPPCHVCSIPSPARLPACLSACLPAPACLPACLLAHLLTAFASSARASLTPCARLWQHKVCWACGGVPARQCNEPHS